MTSLNLKSETTLLDLQCMAHLAVNENEALSYSLTEVGQKFVPVIKALEKFAIEYDGSSDNA